MDKAPVVRRCAYCNFPERAGSEFRTVAVPCGASGKREVDMVVCSDVCAGRLLGKRKVLDRDMGRPGMSARGYEYYITPARGGMGYVKGARRINYIGGRG